MLCEARLGELHDRIARQAQAMPTHQTFLSSFGLAPADAQAAAVGSA